MDEQTTTVQQDDSGAQGALPEDKKQDTAALEANEQKNSQTQGDENKSLPEVDDKLKSFAQGLGIEDVSSLNERELKLLKVAKDNQAEFQRNAQKASQLEKTVLDGTQEAIAEAKTNGTADAGQIALAEIASLKLQNAVNGFFSENPDAKAHEEDMVSLVENRPELKALVREGALTLTDLYAMAVGSNPNTVNDAKAQGGQQALQQLANKQTATAVHGAATTSAMAPAKGDPLMELWSK